MIQQLIDTWDSEHEIDVGMVLVLVAALNPVGRESPVAGRRPPVRKLLAGARAALPGLMVLLAQPLFVSGRYATPPPRSSGSE